MEDLGGLASPIRRGRLSVTFTLHHGDHASSEKQCGANVLGWEGWEHRHSHHLRRSPCRLYVCT